MKSGRTFCRTLLRRFETLSVIARICGAFLVMCIGAYAPASAVADTGTAQRLESSSEVNVGGLGFKVISLRISEDREYGFKSRATISMKIANHGKAPVQLNYALGRANLVNERGYAWTEDPGSGITGLPMAREGRASESATLEPGSEIGISIPLYYSSDNSGQTPGSDFKLGVEFNSYQPMKNGQTKVTRIPVSIAGLHKAPVQAAQPGDSKGGLSAEQRVGDLSFKVKSLRVLEPRDDSGNQSWATISVSITNHGKTPIALDYVGGKTSFVNERGYVWKESKDSGRAIIGVPVAEYNEASVKTVLDPESELTVMIPLKFDSLNHPERTAGNSFDFAAEFVSYENMGEGRLKKLRTYPILFAGLNKTPAQLEPASGSKPAAQPEVRVGDLGFKVDTLKVKEPKDHVSQQSWATINMTIFNHGTSPIALNYVWGKSGLVNERGYGWVDSTDNNSNVSGLPVARDNRASVQGIINPGAEVKVEIPLKFDSFNHPERTSGNFFDFAAEFDAYEDMGEGLVKHVRTYPVSFVGLQKTSGSSGLGGLFGH